jgi:hypothetical protein
MSIDSVQVGAATPLQCSSSSSSSVCAFQSLCLHISVCDIIMRALHSFTIGYEQYTSSACNNSCSSAIFRWVPPCSAQRACLTGSTRCTAAAAVTSQRSSKLCTCKTPQSSCLCVIAIPGWCSQRSCGCVSVVPQLPLVPVVCDVICLPRAIVRPQLALSLSLPLCLCKATWH